MINSSRILLRLVCFLVAVVSLAACAIQPNNRGGYTVGVDTAALFGTEIGRFTLQNGTEGALRREGKKYSIKLSRYQRVIPLPNVDSARIARIENVGERTLVVVETQQGNCNYRYSILAIDASDVLSWELGNCRDRPVALVLDDRSAMAFDFPNGSKIDRFIYTADGRMLRGADNAAPGVNMNAKPFADESLYPPGYLEALRQSGAYPGSAVVATVPASSVRSKPGRRVVPAPPKRTTAGGRPSSSASDKPSGQTTASSPAGNRPPSARVASLPAKLDLPKDEISSTRIDLRD